ncbi:hypothetical protein [Liquorilactobacillus uvarum]|nr:hypothetical protein [Liquorilactobacillus uvarum]
MHIKVKFFTLKGIRIYKYQGENIRMLLEYNADGTFKQIVLLTKQCTINHYFFDFSLKGGLLKITAPNSESKKYLNKNEEEFQVALNNINCDIIKKLTDNILF